MFIIAEKRLFSLILQKLGKAMLESTVSTVCPQCDKKQESPFIYCIFNKASNQSGGRACADAGILLIMIIECFIKTLREEMFPQSSGLLTALWEVNDSANPHQSRGDECQQLV